MNAPSRLVIDFPLRPEFTAQLVLPRDITTQEVERIYALLKTLPIELETVK